METTRPLMLGLVGESAAGKTTLVRGVVRLLGRDGVTPLCLDDYHRYSRAEMLARGLTAADPAANDLDAMARHLAELRQGGQITKAIYDHRTGALRGPEVVAATGLVVAYGMLTLAVPRAHELFDMTVYLEPELALRRAWRAVRDVRERGYLADEVATQAPARERDATRFVQVQRPLASTVVRMRQNSATKNALDIEVSLRSDNGSGDPLCAALGAAAIPGLRTEQLAADEDGRPCDRVVVDATIDPGCAAEAAALIWQRLEGVQRLPLEQVGQVRDGAETRHAPALALVQLLLVARLVAAR